MKNMSRYRLDMFSQSAAPTRKKKPGPELLPKKKSTKKAIERQKREARLKFGLKSIFTGILILIVISIMIYSKVVLNEKVSMLHRAEKELNQLKSENTRLNNDVEHKVSYSYITQYAEKNLGMVKMTSQQIHYINETSGDRVEMYVGEDNTGIIEKFMQKISTTTSDDKNEKPESSASHSSEQESSKSEELVIETESAID